MRFFDVIPSLLLATSLAPFALAAITPELYPRLCTDGVCETSLDRRCCLSTWTCTCPGSIAGQ